MSFVLTVTCGQLHPPLSRISVSSATGDMNSSYDDFVFQDSDAGEVRPEPVPDPTMEVVFRDEDAGISLIPKS